MQAHSEKAANWAQVLRAPSSKAANEIIDSHRYQHRHRQEDLFRRGVKAVRTTRDSQGSIVMLSAEAELQRDLSRIAFEALLCVVCMENPANIVCVPW